MSGIWFRKVGFLVRMLWRPGGVAMRERGCALASVCFGLWLAVEAVLVEVLVKAVVLPIVSFSFAGLGAVLRNGGFFGSTVCWFGKT